MKIANFGEMGILSIFHRILCKISEFRFSGIWPKYREFVSKSTRNIKFVENLRLAGLWEILGVLTGKLRFLRILAGKWPICVNFGRKLAVFVNFGRKIASFVNFGSNLVVFGILAGNWRIFDNFGS